VSHLVIVPHTHWDREWYRTHEEFRYRLVQLLDRLLDLLERDPDFPCFTLDGQTIVVDDYLEVRPSARERIARLVRERRLWIGPWTVLPDEWLVSGEALVRNLRLGLRRTEELGGGLRMGYVPDQFGHVGQLPQLFAGFGLEGAALWRGVGADVDRTLFRWQAPDGTEQLTVYLIHGYGNAAHLPLEGEALAAKLRALIAAQKPHAAVPSLLLMNGSDHLEPEPGLPEALAGVRLEDATVELGSLQGYFERARAEAAGLDLPLHRGELRSGLRSPLLEGCASARMPQKRADFLNDRLLVRVLEPLAAWLGECGGDPDTETIERIWRIALENHPHDSICGCSVDAVHREMDVRFERVEQVARAHLRHVASGLAAHVALAPGEGQGLVVWNPNAPGPTQAEGEVELELDGAEVPALAVRSATGEVRPAHGEVVSPGAVLARYEMPGRVAALLLRGFPGEFTGLRPCAASTRRENGRLTATLWLGEEPPSQFDFVAEREALASALEAEGDGAAVYRVLRRPRVRLAFVDALPGHGLRTYRLLPPGEAAAVEPGDASVPRAGLGSDGGAQLSNGIWRVEVSPGGRVAWRHEPTGAAVEDALRCVSEGDRGDEYTFDPVPGAAPAVALEDFRVELGAGGGACASLVLAFELAVPARLAPDRAARAAERVRLPVRLELRLWQALDRLDVNVELDNTAEDHRLRLLLKAPFPARALEVESAFEIVERPLAPGAGDFGPDPAEKPTGASPQRGFASLHGDALRFTVANRGAAEVEAVGEGGTLAVTLLRAVGWLSRDDLALRPMHAGPALETPGAQVPGRHRVELAVLLHRADGSARAGDADRFVAPAWLFAGGGAEGRLADGARLVAVEPPEVAVSAIEPTPGGGTWVRLYEREGRPVEARVTFHEKGPLEAVDLAGRPLPDRSPDRTERGTHRVALGAHEIRGLRHRKGA
jgi:alpha-mannosidase